MSDSIFHQKYSHIIGIFLATLGSILIGISYTASKTAHNKVRASVQLSASRESSRQAQVSEYRSPHPMRRLHHKLSEMSNKTRLFGYDPVSPSTTPLLLPKMIVESDSLQRRNQLLETVKHYEWWLSILLLMMGQILNFMAYGFASTSLIAPLGTLSIISGAISGYVYLREKIAKRTVFGMILCVLGVAAVVIVARDGNSVPDDGDVIAWLVSSLLNFNFLVYVAINSALIALLIVLDNLPIKRSRSVFGRVESPMTVFPVEAVETLGDKWMLIRVMLTALFSGLSVLATKALSALLTLSVNTMFAYPITYCVIAVLLVGALFTLYYTNKALSKFDSTKVLPAEFAGFTFFAVVGSALLYRDFDGAPPHDIFIFIAGCLVSFIGVYFISSSHQQAFQADLDAPRLIDPVNDRTPLMVSIEEEPGFIDRESSSNLESSPKNRAFDRLSRNGTLALVTVVTALTNNRASLLFQQVVDKHDAEESFHIQNLGDQ